jgi:hypothetical protein
MNLTLELHTLSFDFSKTLKPLKKSQFTAIHHMENSPQEKSKSGQFTAKSLPQSNSPRTIHHKKLKQSAAKQVCHKQFT